MADAAPRAARTAAPARRAGSQRRPPAAAVFPRRGRGKLPFPAAFRWARVAVLVAAVVVGLPLAHAVLGEVAALLGGAVALGFLVGRWTAPGPRR